MTSKFIVANEIFHVDEKQKVLEAIMLRDGHRYKP
jgi:hypothetical protein